MALIKIVAPTSCPSCGYELIWKNDQLFCSYNACSAKTQKSIEHFSKTLKIKGLGSSTIQKLGIEDIVDIYSLSLDEIISALGSEKLATKLYEEIRSSINASLEEVLPAFSIPLIGKSAAAKICTVVGSIYEINEDTCRLAGLGPKASENLLNWFADDFVGFYSYLPFSYKTETKVSVPTNKGVVCISGKLRSFKTKAEAETALNAAGYTVKSSLTKEVTILVNESGIESSKTQKARDSGVTIIDNLTKLF